MAARFRRYGCYVDGMTDGFVRLMQSGGERPVLIGNLEERTVCELAELIAELTGSASQISYGPLPVDNPRRGRPEIERARARLGWSPRLELGPGLSSTINYFREEISLNPKAA